MCVCVCVCVCVLVGALVDIIYITNHKLLRVIPTTLKFLIRSMRFTIIISMALSLVEQVYGVYLPKHNCYVNFYLFIYL
ncbi:hypothetical protein KUTeg_015509 [Tegillarca granosa]|uniref:Uncharacterized protein n=1 Tax=Tegillarca granosa TaxID=220873 RepID=A0ABQ9EVJ4_TEGGR|nr:hypothetical protein KUTeg_015509 [Tegillarca granosa]